MKSWKELLEEELFMKTIKCPDCKGKGHLFDPVSLFVPFISWIMVFFEINNPHGFTRQTCRTCYGKRYIKLDDYEVQYYE